MEREQAARRTRAAMALAGYRSAETLAEALDGSGVGLKRLREIMQERGNEPRRVELREIADACGLPFEFFTMDFAHPANGNGHDLAGQLERQQAAIEGLRDLITPHLRLLRRLQTLEPALESLATRQGNSGRTGTRTPPTG